MPNPRYSIVIPTRNRGSTLPYAITTCLTQTLSDFEVVVFDNCSTSPAAEHCSLIRDARVKYVRSETSLAMTDSWERAISYATGEYLTVIGDDDGLLPYALEVVDRVLRSSNVSALRWEWAHYRWPDSAPPDEANQLQIIANGPSCVVDSQAAIRAVSQQKWWYGRLPMIYNSFVHRNVIEEIRRASGRFLFATSPDVYSGFAIAHRVGRYASLGFPLAVAGVSAASNGTACLRGVKDNPIAKDFSDLNSAAGINWCPRIPRVTKSINAVTAEAFEWARERLFPTGYVASTDLPRLTNAIIADFRFRARITPGELEESLAEVRRSLRDHPRSLRWLDRFCRATPLGCVPTGWRAGLNDNSFFLDASRFGVSNVVEAAKFVESLLGEPSAAAMTLSSAERPSLSAEWDRTHGVADSLTKLGRNLVPPLFWRLAQNLSLGRRARQPD